MTDRSASYAACLDELAAALERAGAPAEASARLMELASIATLRAVALDQLVAPAPPPRVVAPVERRRAA